MTLLYFTATGNNLYVAKTLGGERFSIPQMVKENHYTFSDEKIGIIFPIYSISVPQYIEEFLQKATFECEYLFAIMTYGAYDGATPKHLASIAQKAGYSFDYINTLKMVDNWIPGFDMDKQVKNEPKKQIEKHLQQIKKDIEESKKWILKTSRIDNLATGYMVRDAEKQSHTKINKESLHGNVTGLGIKPFITVQDTCIQCGVCAKVCPVDNIRLDGKKISL